jgi:hypothetical protein
LDDLYKLVHQGAMGSEHSGADEPSARAWLERELAEMGPGPEGHCPEEPLVDPISLDGSIVRVHLRTHARLGLGTEPLLAAFLRTAREFRGSMEILDEALVEVARLAGEGLIAFDCASVERFAAQMRAAGFPAVHHSAAYAAAYRPAYRVMARAALPLDVARR